MCFIDKFKQRIEEEDDRQVAKAKTSRPKPKKEDLSPDFGKREPWVCHYCLEPLDECDCGAGL